MPRRSNTSLARESKKPLRREWVEGRRFDNVGTKLLRGRANFKGRLKSLEFSLTLANCCTMIDLSPCQLLFPFLRL
jgi:hypothetical protein